MVEVFFELVRHACQYSNLSRKKHLTPADALFLAGPTGFEPAISSVTGRRDRPASLRAHGLPVAGHVLLALPRVERLAANKSKTIKNLPLNLE
jgi:hypothetical protein